MKQEILAINNDYKIIEYTNPNGTKFRTLETPHATQSITSCVEEEKYELIDPHIELYDMIPSFNEVNTVLVLGGGAFTYPKYFLKKYSNKTMDVVEINPELYQISADYFYLKEAIDKYDPENNRFHVIIDDAYEYIKQGKKYDAIFVDLFNDSEPIQKTFDSEVLDNLKASLSENGYIYINYIKKERFDNALESGLNESLNYFKNAKVVATSFHYHNGCGNILIILSDNEIELPDDFDYKVIPLNTIIRSGRTL